MYCQNCGKKIDEKAVICIGCGCAIKRNGKGKGIASMVLGILAIIYSLIAFLVVLDDEAELYSYYSASEMAGYIIGSVLIQSVLAIISVSLAASERKTNKNGFNTSGLWLSISSFILIAIQIIILICN